MPRTFAETTSIIADEIRICQATIIVSTKILQKFYTYSGLTQLSHAIASQT
jgi:hypothetical protein